MCYDFLIYLSSRTNLLKFAFVISKLSFPGLTIFCVGSLGIGKTIFAKSFIGSIIFYKFLIKSATYSILESYYYNKFIFVSHCDLYRLDKSITFFYSYLKQVFVSFSIFFLECNKFLFYLFFSFFYIYFFFYLNLIDRFLFLKSFCFNFYILLEF